VAISAVTAGGEYVVADNELPAAVQGRLVAALTLDGAGSNDRGI